MKKAIRIKIEKNITRKSNDKVTVNQIGLNRNVDDTQPSHSKDASSFVDANKICPSIEFSQPQEQIIDYVDIESDSDIQTETVEEPETPRREGLRQRSYRPLYEVKISESDESEEEGIPPRKTIKLEYKAAPDKGFASIDEPAKFLEKLNRKPDSDLMDNYVRLFVDGRRLSRREGCERELSSLSEILKKNGHIVEHLSLNKFSWKEKVTSNDALNIPTILLKLCKNLTVLKLHGRFTDVELSSKTKAFDLPNLREIIYHCGVRESTQDYTFDNFYTMYLNIFNGALSLEKLEYTFSTLEEANAILDACTDAKLKKLRSLLFRNIKEDGVLQQHQIQKLCSISSTLETLELGNGLWEDVQASTMEKMLSKFPNLRKLTIHGFLQGDSHTNANEICIKFPRLEKLTKLSIGAQYEFASIFQEPYSRRRNVTEIAETKIQFLKFQIRFTSMPNLKSIILGNLINIDNLTFKDFPKLEVFRVGGPWNITCDFLNEPPHSRLTELQFPDALKDSSLSKNIPEMFPALKKLWIYLPSVTSLQSFFMAMANAHHVKVEELYLKTQFDFESTLESCLLGLSTSALRSERDINNLNLLKQYTHFENFVAYYNIELPCGKVENTDSNDDIVTAPGIGVLKFLKILHMEHIPRVLRIPSGVYHFSDYRCRLTSDTIGYKKYPLSQKCVDKLPLKNLENCLWPNFEFVGRNLNKFVSRGFRNQRYSLADEESNVPGKKKSKKLSVTIQPSMLLMRVFKGKKEN